MTTLDRDTPLPCVVIESPHGAVGAFCWTQADARWVLKQFKQKLPNLREYIRLDWLSLNQAGRRKWFLLFCPIQDGQTQSWTSSQDDLMQGLIQLWNLDEGDAHAD